MVGAEVQDNAVADRLDRCDPDIIVVQGTAHGARLQ